jgi:hypothetical protein
MLHKVVHIKEASCHRQFLSMTLELLLKSRHQLDQVSHHPAIGSGLLAFWYVMPELP